MSTLGATVTTLADIAKNWDPDGRPARIVELLSQSNRVLDDMHWEEGNLPFGSQITVRTGLPTSFWRLANQGVAPSKSTEAQFTEQCGILEQWSEVDKVIAELNGNTAAYRLNRAKAGIESMNQEMVGTMFYGNTGTAPEEFLGLSVRYNDDTAGNGQNIIDGGGLNGQTDCSSIWLIGWGPNSVYGIYPKGTMGGLQHEDLGLQTVETTAGVGGTRMRAYQDHWMWRPGIAVADWRYAVRIANIDISLLVANSTGTDLIDAMIKAYHRIPFPETVRLAYYMNRTTFQMLNIQRRDAAIGGTGITMSDIDGRLIPTFNYNGIPIRIVDQLTEAETSLN